MAESFKGTAQRCMRDLELHIARRLVFVDKLDDSSHAERHMSQAITSVLGHPSRQGLVQIHSRGSTEEITQRAGTQLGK